MKNKLIAFSSLGLGLSFVPFFASAQTVCGSGQTGTLIAVICKIGQLLNTIIPILITLGVVYFVWGVISYVVSADEEQKTKGRDKMIYGIIGLVVIVGLWGLVAIVTNTFGLQGTQSVSIPCIVGTPGC